MSIDSIKHKKEKRAHIPSREEAGYEDANPDVRNKIKSEYPLNPVIHRGQDPELFWLNKYGNDDREELLKVDIRSLYRYEHISPELLIKKLYNVRKEQAKQRSIFDINELFGNALDMEEFEKVSEYYKHQDGWTNRLIQGDSLLVMTSLLEREGMAGKVQMIYFDPPYGIKYGSNWQMKMHDLEVKEGKDEFLSGEPEQIKAFRDTWELGIHSYLSYLRDRLVIAKEILTESGSCFVQISDENVHLVRNILDEIFGSENFLSQLTVKRASVMFTKKYIKNNLYYILWYCKNINSIKYNQLFLEQDLQEFSDLSGSHLWFQNINTKENIKSLPENRKNLKDFLKNNHELIPFGTLGINAQGTEKQKAFTYNGKSYFPPSGTQWKTSYSGLERLAELGRLIEEGNKIRYKYFFKDYPVTEISNYWESIGAAGDKTYVVQTNDEILQRCILMSTSPGDLVLDPTCGSGTTANVAEQWGRRWITIDTSRIAINIAKTRLMTASFPYYYLYSDHEVAYQPGNNGKIKATISPKKPAEQTNDIQQGFIYEKVPHITLKSLANDEPPEEETLYDKPYEDKKKLRVAGPFTVETLQNFEPLPPEALDEETPPRDDLEKFEERIFSHLKSAGIKNGMRNEQAVFTRVERINHSYLHAEGFYPSAGGERKAYFHIGPKFGTVSKRAVNEAVKECRTRGDADWLVILGFSFESAISNENITTSMGSFEVTRTRMHDDLLQDGLLKKDRKAASFVTIGEPDIAVHELNTADCASESVLVGKESSAKCVQVEIRGLDIYDPIKDEVKARNVADIAYWMVDDDYDGSNFIVRQVFFCGGDRDEFDKWKRGLNSLSLQSIKKAAELTLKIEMDDDAFERVYGFKSHPLAIKGKGQRIAVRVISQFGEESTKILEL